MTYTIATVLCGAQSPQFPHTLTFPHDSQMLAGLCAVSTGSVAYSYIDNSRNEQSPCQCYQQILNGCGTDVLIYIHSDVTIHDPNWLQMTMDLFKPIFGKSDPREPGEVVAVGFGGATSLGRPNLYKEPYNIWNLARGGYASNQTDAETHGERFTGVRRVAVLDAFFMAIRTDFLRSVGGWPTKHLTHHVLDLWLACEARRHDKEIWMVGANCTHWGGGASTGGSYAKAPWLQGGSMESDHTIPHRWLADEYRDVLPFSV